MDYRGYRILVMKGRVQVHHVTCTAASTWVLDWSENSPEGMSVDTIVNSIQDHEQIFGHSV